MSVFRKVSLNNPNLIKLLENGFNKNKISHAFIFSAPEGVQINDEPMLLINSIIENKVTEKDNSKYSDLTIIDGAEGMIKKEFIINAITKMSLSALDSRGYKILFIKNIENANKSSLNSLLKFIEEPQDKTHIIMTTNKLGGVLSTIKSRSQIINIKGQSKKSIKESLTKIDEPKKSIIAEISSSTEEALKFFETKQKLLDIIFELFSSYKDKNEFQIELNKIINKSNYKDAILIFRVFINDIWKQANDVSTITGLTSQLNKYNNIDYKSILEATSNFIRTLEKFGNFELAKTRLLLEIGENYG